MTQAQASSSIDRKVIVPVVVLAVGAIASFVIGRGVLVLVLVVAIVFGLFYIKRVSGRARVLLLTVLVIAAIVLVWNLAASATIALTTDSF